MHIAPETSYALLLLGLLLRFVALVTVQAVFRLNRRQSFRWPEDVALWGGTLAAPDEDGPVARAQAEMRNDSESVPLFLIAMGWWVLQGAGPLAVALVAALYLLARSLHALWMVRPRQPHRNRAYGLSMLCLLWVVLDGLRLTLTN